jgi:hypothetical protein
MVYGKIHNRRDGVILVSGMVEAQNTSLEEIYGMRVTTPSFMELLDKTLKDLTKFLADTYCPKLLFKCYLDSFSYEMSLEDAKEMKIIPPVDDVGDVRLTLYTVGGYSGGELLSVSIESASDIEISLEDRDVILEKINDKVTLRDFLRMSYTFAWRYEKNKFMRVTGRAMKNGETIEELMKNIMNLRAVPEPDVVILITKHFDELDEVRYETDIIRVPLTITIRNTTANVTLTDIIDTFKFGFAPLWAKP